MANAYKLIAQVIPGTNASTIYTASAVQAIIRHVNYINIVGSNVSIELWQNGTSDVNKILGGKLLVPANDGTQDGSIEKDVYVSMAASNTISARAGASNAIVVNLWGVEIT